MLCQVIICTVSNTPKFAPSKWEKEFDIGSCFTVEGQFLFVVITYTHLFFFHSERFQPVNTEIFPVCKPFKVCVRFTEEFKFHLLELTCTECKVTRCNLVTERFTDLTDTKWNLLTGCSLNIFKVYKNTLSCLRS